MENNSVTKRKLVIVGDGGCGKTSLLNAYTNRIFCEDYIPTGTANTLLALPFNLEKFFCFSI